MELEIDNNIININQLLTEEEIETVKDHLKCSICTGVFVNPVCFCKEGHTFCKECLTKAIERNANCPVCREVYEGARGTAIPYDIINDSYRIFTEIINQNGMDGFDGQDSSDGLEGLVGLVDMVGSVVRSLVSPGVQGNIGSAFSSTHVVPNRINNPNLTNREIRNTSVNNTDRWVCNLCKTINLNSNSSCRNCFILNIAALNTNPSLRTTGLSNNSNNRNRTHQFKLCTNVEIKRQINEIKVNCPFSYKNLRCEEIDNGNGCPGRMNYGDVKDHLSKCRFKFIQCQYGKSNCHILRLNNQTQHYSGHRCQFKIIKCHYCNNQCLLKNFNQHLDKCPVKLFNFKHPIIETYWVFLKLNVKNNILINSNSSSITFEVGRHSQVEYFIKFQFFGESYCYSKIIEFSLYRKDQLFFTVNELDINSDSYIYYFMPKNYEDLISQFSVKIVLEKK